MSVARLRAPLLIPSLCLAAALAVGQDSAPPASPQPTPQVPSCQGSQPHRQFDFWLGEWDVSAGGKKVGVNRISTILAGCVLLEEWKGNGGSEGRSFNYYDAHAGQWVQNWVDRGGGNILARGGLEGGAMRLEGVHTYGDGHTELFRMTFTPNADGSVRQLIQESKDDGKTWYVWFDGTYTRRP